MHQPVPFNGNPLVGTPTPEPVVPATPNGIQVLPAPVVIAESAEPTAAFNGAQPNGLVGALPLNVHSVHAHTEQAPPSSRRLNAPPLPANAFAHLEVEARGNATSGADKLGAEKPGIEAPGAPPFAPNFGVTQPYPAPPVEVPPVVALGQAAPLQAPAIAAAPIHAPAHFGGPLNGVMGTGLESGGGGPPASLYSALGFATPPQAASPADFQAPAFAAAARLTPVPTRARPSWAEVSVLGLLALVSAFVVLQRNGYTQQWFGPNPQSSYARFERSIFGQPSIATVAGVKAFLKELSLNDASDTTSPRKTTSAADTSAKTRD